MGIFYYVKSIALSEDLPGVEREGGFDSPEQFYNIADTGYIQVCTFANLFDSLYNNAVSVMNI
jgi:hypothetical protein